MEIKTLEIYYIEERNMQRQVIKSKCRRQNIYIRFNINSISDGINTLQYADEENGEKEPE